MTKVDGRLRTKNNTKVKEESDAESVVSVQSLESLRPDKKKVHPCEHCGKTFNNKSMLVRHVRTHTGEKPYSCTKCDAKFSQVGGLKKHGLERHGSEIEDSPVYQCNHCDRWFTIKERLRLHLRIHTGERPYLCPHCPKRFSRNGTLQHHIRMHSGVRPYACKICNAAYRSVANLNNHMMRHRGQRDFVCELCGKRFTRRDGLLKHLACIHYNERAFRCSICNKAFKGHILAHLRTHVMDKPHKCSECGARFIQSSQLVVHMRRHTGMKPYICPMCNVAFSYSTVLRLHMRLHTGEKPFKCLLCPSSFVQLPHLKKHMRCIHKTEKPYLCLPCYLFFKTKRELDAHFAEERCKVALVPAAPTQGVPENTQSSPAEAATAEGARAKLEAATPGEAAIKVDPGTPPARKGRKRKSDAQLSVDPVPVPVPVPVTSALTDNILPVDLVPAAKTRKSSVDAPAKTPMRNGGTAKKKAQLVLVAQTTQVPQAVVPTQVAPTEKTTPSKGIKTVIKMPEKPVRTKNPPLRHDPENVIKALPPSPTVRTMEEEESAVDDPEPVKENGKEEEGMPISVVRGLLSTLLARISAPERLEALGHGKILVDKVLCASIESSGRTACRDASLSERECLLRNVQILLEWTIPKQYMDCFKRESRSTEDLLEELTS